MQLRRFFSWVALYMAFLAPLLGVLKFEGPSIVFVHLGEQVPSYLEIAVKQARLFNSCNIVVIANEIALRTPNRALEAAEAICVPCEGLAKTPEHRSFLQNSKLDKTFRNGFWSHATERFFYLQDFMEQYHVNDVIHLENDNMIYVDVASLMPIFHERYPHIGLTMDNDDRCVAGIVYIANAPSMNHLSNNICEQLIRGDIDMYSLGNYCKKFNGKIARQLPIIMNSYVHDNALISNNQNVAKNKFNYCKNYHVFSSIFDAAAIGQYLGGIDPRNGPSKPGFINEGCVFNPSLLTIFWKRDKVGRLIPHAQYRQQVCRINNLHIHSKNLRAFLSDRDQV